MEHGNKDATKVCQTRHKVGSNMDRLSSGRVLYVMHMPPPVHGASMVGRYIKESRLLLHRFDGKYINLTTALALNDIGQVGLKKLVRYVQMLRNVRKTIKEWEPDVIYVTPNSAGIAFYKDFITVSLIKYWISDLSSNNTKIIVHYHNKGVKDFSKHKTNNWLYKIFFKDIYVLLLSEALYEDVRMFVPISRVGFCGNGLPEFNDVKNERIIKNLRKKTENKTNSPIHILYLSNMMADKGVWTLVDACKMLKEKGVPFKCTFVGGWKDISEDAFRKKIISLSLDTEIFAVGPKYGDEKEEYWMDADVFVHPTHNDCFPLVLLEAMQYALPCISTEEGAIPDIIDDNETGFVVCVKNPNHLAEKMIELATDKDKRINMGMAGYKKFKNQYTLKVFENRMCDVLEQLM